MSQKTPIDTTPVITTVPENEPETSEEIVEEKQSRITKTKNFLKTHKQTAIAGAAMVGLVGVSAVLGRKTAPSYDSPNFVLEPGHDVEADIIVDEVPETETA